MSQAHDTLMHREAEFARWLDWVASEKKRLHGWSTARTIDQSSIDRATWYRWKKISKTGNMPRPVNLDQFCQSLGLDPETPYRILGWGKPSSQPVELPDSESPAERQMRLIRLRLSQNPPTKERHELEIALVQLRASERMQADAVSAAEEALRQAEQRQDD